MNKIYNKHTILVASICSLLILGSCSEDFLKPDPLSFYEPTSTFSTEEGLKASLATCDISLRNYWTNVSGSANSVVIGTELMFSDMGVYGKTDFSGGNTMNFNIADNLTPTSGMAGPSSNDGNYIMHYWTETYYGIKYANTILSYVDKVPDLDEATKNAYKGRAYFHRAFRYLTLVFQFGDVPLLTKLLEVPKQNYKSTPKAEILKMITLDMEEAVKLVPEQKDMTYAGAVNKGACRMLLAKCYLATGQWEKAKSELDILINSSGYELMQETFGGDYLSAAQETWKVTPNVIWNLHRPENKLITANKEVILGLPNRGEQSRIDFQTMRIFAPWYNSGSLKDPYAVNAMDLYARNNNNYREDTDWGRAVGRGIGTHRPTGFAQHEMWIVNGVEDTDDLRHNSKVGNWINMEDITYSSAGSTLRGKNLMLYSDRDIPALDKDGNQERDEKGELVWTRRIGDILTIDTIRCWYDWPHYKIYISDATNEANMGSNAYVGGTKGSTSDWYFYRLAEAYLLRAEAKFYMGDATATEDLNILRRRAKCSQLYTGNVTIGDIMNERGRELFLEEWRHTELSRVSYCLALSGKADEWGNTYDVNTYDKQQGTDLTGGSYWYQRTVRVGGIYNKGGVYANNRTLNYKIAKHNIYWPIPNTSITSNSKAKLAQNFGYDGYDANVEMWKTWEEAVADEDRTE